MSPPDAEPTSCDEHPLANLRKLTAWHDDQHPELSFLKAVERERRNLIVRVENLQAESERLREVLESQALCTHCADCAVRAQDALGDHHD